MIWLELRSVSAWQRTFIFLLHAAELHHTILFIAPLPSHICLSMEGWRMSPPRHFCQQLYTIRLHHAGFCKLSRPDTHACTLEYTGLHKRPENFEEAPQADRAANTGIQHATASISAILFGGSEFRPISVCSPNHLCSSHYPCCIS